MPSRCRHFIVHGDYIPIMLVSRGIRLIWFIGRDAGPIAIAIRIRIRCRVVGERGMGHVRDRPGQGGVPRTSLRNLRALNGTIPSRICDAGT